MEEKLETEEKSELTVRCLELLIDKDRQSHTGKLIRGLIHNINGPLQNMSMLVEMLARGQNHMHGFLSASAPDRVAEIQDWEAKQLQRIDRLSQQISALADMLRDFMVIQEIERNGSEVDLNLTLSTLARVFRADLFCKHCVKVDLLLEDNLPPVRILGCDLIPALMHLFQNALTAVRDSEEKRVTIKSSRRDGVVHILFCDTGCGPAPCMDGEDPFKLFSSYWPDGSHGSAPGDSYAGFGLYAVRKLLVPYGVKSYLERSERETLAVLEIPITR